jgi:hypothetical protein
MQVLCKSSNDRVEMRCSVCGQGFALYWERQTPAEQAEALKAVETALNDHHRDNEGGSVHPEGGFLIPEWNGPIAFSGAAILGNAPRSAVEPQGRNANASRGSGRWGERRVQDRRQVQNEGRV